MARTDFDMDPEEENNSDEDINKLLETSQLSLSNYRVWTVRNQSHAYLMNQVTHCELPT